MCVQFLAKYTLFFFNLVFWLGSVALIGIGIAVLKNFGDIVDILPVDLSPIPILVIVTGCVIFVITFSGCCGAIRESRCLLIIYAVFMLILAAAMSYLAYVVLSELDALPTKVGRWVDEAFDNNLTDNKTDFHILETVFECCGARGVESYTSAGLLVPPTCCPQPTDNYSCDLTQPTYKGCAARLGDYLESYGGAVGGIIIAIIVIEVIAMLLAFYLNSSITEKRRKRY